MKKVHPDREVTGLTLTVEELINHLRRFDGDLPVIATWEGVCSAVSPADIYIIARNGRNELEIDVEQYG